jgi:hypothetical protein
MFNDENRDILEKEEQKQAEEEEEEINMMPVR